MGYLLTERIKNWRELSPLELEQRIQQELVKITEENIEKMRRGRRRWEAAVKKEPEVVERKEIVVQALYRLRPQMGLIVTPERQLPAIEEIPMPLRNAISKLQKKVEQFTRVAMPQELRTQVKVGKNIIRQLESAIAEVKSIASAVNYSLADPAIAMPLSQAESLLRQWQTRVRQWEEQLERLRRPTT